MFLATGRLAGARWAVTDRLGGVSVAPYDSLNLGGHVGDEADDVRVNRDRLAGALDVAPARLRFMAQVHGATVARVGAGADSADGAADGADAMVTTEPGLALAVLVADCVPVLLAAPGHGGPVAAVAHAGRRGVVAGVVPATLAAMADAGARVSRAVAVVGPAICGRCYEVPADLQQQVSAAVSETRATTASGTPGLDLRAGVVAQLVAGGVGAVEVSPWCTAERADLFSYRRDGVTGRLAGVVSVPA